MKRHYELEEALMRSILEINKKDREGHVKSGRLSASALCKPLLWQVLSYLKLDSPKNANSIMTMRRGVDMEKLVLDYLGFEKPTEDILYRGVIGKLDSFYKTDDGRYPLEIKSVSRDKFRRITTAGVPDEQYAIQAGLYGLALNTDKFYIMIVNSTDYRTLCYEMNTQDYKQQIDSKIDSFEFVIKNKIMPRFEANYKFYNDVKYQDFPAFNSLSPDEIVMKLKMEYPEAYKIWTNNTLV